MLIRFVYVYIKNKTSVYYFMEGPHAPVTSLKVTGALSSYICNCNF